MLSFHLVSLQLSFLNKASAAGLTLLWSPVTMSGLEGVAPGVGVGEADPLGVGEAEPEGVGVADDVGFGVEEDFGEVDGDGEDDALASGLAPAACPFPPDLLADGLGVDFGACEDFGELDPVGRGAGEPVGNGDGSGVGTVDGAEGGSPLLALTPT